MKVSPQEISIFLNSTSHRTDFSAAVPQTLSPHSASSSSQVPDYILESVQSLPPLPNAVQRLLALTRKVDVDFNKIAQIIESDQVLTARTLRAANSALYGMSRRVETVSKATVLLGREAILNLALSASMLNLYDGANQEWPIAPESFWRHNIAVAHTAQWLARHQSAGNSESAFVAGLMHDIGKLVLLIHHRDAYADVLREAQTGETPLPILEREALDTDHSEVGSLLCQHWKLPDTITEAVALHHTPSNANAIPPLAGTVLSANVLIKMYGMGESGAHVVNRSLPSDLPHEAVDPNALYDFLANLPAEVYRAEKAFTNNPEPPPTVPPAEERSRIPVQFDRPAEGPLVGAMLTSMGYTPVITPEAAEAETLDFSAWRAEQEVTCADQYLPIKPLRQWLTRNLARGEED